MSTASSMMESSDRTVVAGPAGETAPTDQLLWHEPPQVLFVVNPVAGRCSIEEVRRVLGEAFERQGWNYRVYETTGADDFTALVRAAQEQGDNLIVAAGGDGTVSDVASAMVGTGIPLGILPLGTGNVLSLDLGLPQNLQQATALLVGPHRACELDAMRIGDRYYFLQVGVGIDALMIRDTDRLTKRRFGRAAYIATLFRALSGYSAKRYRLCVDGRAFHARAWDVLIANAGTVGIPIFRWGREISPVDGHLDLVVLKVRGPSDYLRTLWYLLFGLPRSGPPVSLYPVVKEATVASKRSLPVQADGEIIGRTPVTVGVVPGAITVVVPPTYPTGPPTQRREGVARERAGRLRRRLRRWLGPIGPADTTAPRAIPSPRSPAPGQWPDTSRAGGRRSCASPTSFASRGGIWASTTSATSLPAPPGASSWPPATDR